MVVVLVTGLSFAGYVPGKRLGAARGTLAAAAIAATVSSTAVISELSRPLRNPAEDAAVLKAGLAGAAGGVFLRVLLWQALDRESVAEGKSVADPVVHGGRGVVKKKK